MADERDERGDGEREGEPKIKVVDRRMLNEEERAGSGSASSGSAASNVVTSGGATTEESGKRPRLEIVGGGSSREESTPMEPDDAADAPVCNRSAEQYANRSRYVQQPAGAPHLPPLGRKLSPPSPASAR